MPLLTSPIDGSPMKQIKRFGIEIDVCPASGGMWLDKSELEKLIHFIKEEAAAEQSNYAPPPQYQSRPQQGYQTHYKRDDDDWDDDDHPKHGYGYKKKSKTSKLLDLFDF